MAAVIGPEMEPSSTWRRARLLLALGPLAGISGALLGFAFGIDGPRGLLFLNEIPPGDRIPLLAAVSFFAALLTLLALVVGWDRGRPLHAIKAGATIAALLFLPGLLLGVLIAGAGC